MKGKILSTAVAVFRDERVKQSKSQGGCEGGGGEGTERKKKVNFFNTNNRWQARHALFFTKY